MRAPAARSMLGTDPVLPGVDPSDETSFSGTRDLVRGGLRSRVGGATALPGCESQKIHGLASDKQSDAAARCEWEESLSRRFACMARNRIRTATRRGGLHVEDAVPNLTGA